MSARSNNNMHAMGGQDNQRHQMQEQSENAEDIPYSPSRDYTTASMLNGHETPISTMTAQTLEQQLRETEARYRSLISATSQIVWITDKTGLRAGDLTAWCAYTGQTLQEADGPSVMNAIHPDDRAYVDKAWLKAISTKQPYEAEYRLRRHDGIYRIFHSRAVPVFNLDGSIREWVGINTDITEHKQLEMYLQQSETRFRLMFEQANIGMVFAALPDGHLQQVNHRFCEMIGYSEGELLHRTALSLTHPDDSQRTAEVLEQLMHGTQSCTFEKRYIRKDGSLLWVNITMSVIHDLPDTTPHYLAVIEDITERRHIQEEAAQRASEFEAMVTAMTDGLIFLDRQGNLVRVNPAARQMFGMDAAPNYQSSSLASRAALFTVYDEHGNLLEEDALPTARILHGEILAGENIIDATFHTPDGREVLVSISGSPIYNSEGEITNGVLIARDITHYRKLEHRTHVALESLLSMAEALVHLPESTGDIHALGKRLSDLTCDILDCQRVGLLAIEPDTEIIRPVGVAGLSPEWERAWWQEQEQMQSSLKDNPTPEIIARLENKEVILVDMMQPPFRDNPNLYHIKVMLIAPMFIQDRIIGFLTLDYGEDAHVYTQNEVSLAGAVAQLLALVIERQRLLTERAEAEGREVALREANRRMEEFLDIASHELRTPLTTIKANIQLAKKRIRSLAADETLASSTAMRLNSTQDMLTRAERQVGVLNRLVGDLIDVSRIQTGKLQIHIRQEPTDLTQLVTETVEELRKTHPDRVITVTFTPETVQQAIHVVADPDRITQVLTNYLSNALKYSSTNRPVEVLVNVLQEKGTESIQQTARVSVRDQGPGLPLEEQQRIWECFYQVEDVKVVSGSGVGLGLGLYISQIIIERHNGHVGVDSTPGTGSTFWFTLPVA